LTETSMFARQRRYRTVDGRTKWSLPVSPAWRSPPVY
jgi:hypothetical protein